MTELFDRVLGTIPESEDIARTTFTQCLDRGMKYGARMWMHYWPGEYPIADLYAFAMLAGEVSKAHLFADDEKETFDRERPIPLVFVGDFRRPGFASASIKELLLREVEMALDHVDWEKKHRLEGE